MKHLLTFLAICLVLAIILFIGDYFNVPLWPINIFNRTYLLELQCRLETYNKDEMKQFLEAEGGITIELLDKHKKPLKNLKNLNMKTDLDGIFRIYLPHGEYYVRSEVMTYYNNQLYHFATNDPGNFESMLHEQSNSKHTLVLKQLELNNYSVLRARLDRFLKEGNVAASKALLDEILDRKNATFIQDKRKLLDQDRILINQITSMTEQVKDLPIDHYMSQLDIFMEIKELFRKLLPSDEPSTYRVRLDDELLFIQPRINSIKAALSQIWSEYMTSIDAFMKIRNYTRAYSIWLKFIQNKELYKLDFHLGSEELEERLIKFQESLPSLEEKIVRQLLLWIENGTDYYEKNDIERANEYFTKALTITTDYAVQLELEPDVVKDVESYCQDIQTLQTARRYYEMGEWKKVLQLYSNVSHESQWLRVQRTELKNRLKKNGDK